MKFIFSPVKKCPLCHHKMNTFLIEKNIEWIYQCNYCHQYMFHYSYDIVYLKIYRYNLTIKKSSVKGNKKFKVVTRHKKRFDLFVIGDIIREMQTKRTKN